MSTSTLSALLAAANARVLAGVSGSRLSEETVHTIQSSTRSPVHKEFAIGRLSSRPERTPQRASEGIPERHELTVVAAYQLPPKDRQAGLQAASDYAAAIRTALLGTTWTSTIAARITYTGTTEQPGPDGWVWLTLTFDALQSVTIS